MQLDPVEPGLLGAPGRPGKLVDDLVDFLDGHCPSKYSVKEILLAGRAQAFLIKIFDPAHVLLPSGMTELHAVPAVISMNELADFAPERDFVIIIDHCVPGQNSPPHRDRGV